MKLTKKQIIEDSDIGNGPTQPTQMDNKLDALRNSVEALNKTNEKISAENDDNNTSNTRNTDDPRGINKSDTQSHDDNEKTVEVPISSLEENYETIGGDANSVINKIMSYPEIDMAVKKINKPEERADLITQFAARIGIPDKLKRDIAQWVIKNASVGSNTGDPSDIETIGENTIFTKRKLITTLKAKTHDK